MSQYYRRALCSQYYIAGVNGQLNSRCPACW